VNSNDSWITVTGNNSGNGNATINFEVDQYTSTNSRSGTISIDYSSGSKVFSINQTGCSYSVSPDSQIVPPAGGNYEISVNSESICEWQATENIDWIEITNGQSGVGSGMVNYYVSSNSFSSERTGTITIKNNVFIVKQLGVTTSVNIDKPGLPTEFNLAQNYPNPFNPSTEINYSIPQVSFVSIKVYDILGREIRTLVNEEKFVGYYEVNFDASSLSSGVYFYRLQAGKFSDSKKFILMK